MDAHTLFDILSDENRRNILLLLLRQGEQCVCNLYTPLNMSQPKASRHLAVMREAGLVIARRDGKWMHYRLNPQMPLWSYRILEAMRDGCPEAPGAFVACGSAEAEGPSAGGCGASIGEHPIH